MKTYRPGVQRRSVTNVRTAARRLAPLATLLALAARPAAAADIDLSLVDVQNTQYAAPSVWSRHFNVYGSAGATTARAQTGWSDQQFPDGTWRDSTWLPYMKSAVAHGLRLSIDLETIAAPPSWFIDANLDARLVDQNGLTTQYQTISYWWPGLRAMIHAKTDTMLSMLAAAGVLTSADTVIASLGPADEPLYPPQWTVGNGSVAPGFWCYDVHAQADFVVQMTAKYHTIAAANAAWGTSYASLAALTVPKPGTVPAAEWADVISWYRTTKRAFVAWQVADTTAELAKWAPAHAPTLVVPIPGDHIAGDELAAALASESSSDPAIVQMNDTDFMLDTAAINHASVHFTGMPDMPELEFIRGYIRGRGYDAAGMRLTAENVNTPSAATDVAEYTAEALAVDLDGFDYLYGSALFASDGITALASLAPITAMEAAIAQGRDAPRTSLALPPNFILVQNGCVDITPASTAGTTKVPATQLCLSASGQLFVWKNAVVWQAPSPAQSCPPFAVWNKACFAVFQGDGNLVLYNGTTPYWATGTGVALATGLTLSASKPYLTLTNASGAATWDSTAGRHQ